MTREDLAKDILIAFIPQWPDIAANLTPTDDPITTLAKHSVQLADALLEALGAKEAPASWLSKEMQTPVKPGCLPVLRTVEPGVSVVIREPGHVCDGMFGIVASKFGTEDLWSVDIGKTTHAVLSCSSLEVR